MFKDDLKKARKRAGITQADLAKRTGLSYSYITKLESGEATNPTLETAERLYDVLKDPELILSFPDLWEPDPTPAQLLKEIFTHMQNSLAWADAFLPNPEEGKGLEIVFSDGVVIPIDFEDVVMLADKTNEHLRLLLLDLRNRKTQP